MGKKSLRRRIQAIKDFPDFFIRWGQKYSLVRKVFFSHRTEYPWLKGVCGFLFGLLLGLMFYELLISELGFGTLTTIFMTGVTTLFLAVGCAISFQMRCTCLLMFPSLCGRTGRSSLKALVIAYIITGPIQSLILNTKEVIRTFACTTTLAYNLTKTKLNLIFKPFRDGITGVKSDTGEIKETLKTVQQVVAPIENEIVNDKEIEETKEINDYIDEIQEDTKRSDKIEKKYDKSKEKDINKQVEDDYFKKLEYRCEGVMSAAGGKCRKIFAKAYEGCEEAVSWVAAWAICWPMKLTFVCNVVSVLGGDDACDAKSQIGPGFGKGFNFLMNSKNMVSSEFKPPRIQFRIPRPDIPIDVRGAADTAQAIYQDFEQKRSVIDTIMIILKRILSLMIIRIILKAQSYQEQYISDIEFDNIYITKYFKKIDARRKAAGKLALLPLKKIEKPKFIDPYSAKLSSREKSHIVGHTVKILVELMTVSGLLIVERVYFELLDLVRRHGKIEFHQSGHHDMSIKVKGTGMVARIVRSIVKNFNFKKKIDQTYSNEFCLPRPKHLKLRDYRNIYGLYVIIFVMVIVEGYVQRLRWVICAYFYPKREKKRILYSYNETLRQRKGFYKYMKKKIKSMIRENKSQQDVNYLLLLKMKFPKLLGWLDRFAATRRKCLICAEIENKKKDQWYECPVCLYIYCGECWSDIGRLCLVCNPTQEEDSADEPKGPDLDEDSD